MTAIERLEALLDEKDEEISKLSEKVEELETDLRGVRDGWARHTELPQEQTLPVPRLELSYSPEDPSDGWGSYVVLYRMVYRHFLGHCVSVPLGQTRISGRSYRDPPLRDGKLDFPHRDGAHIKADMVSLGFPGFAICGDRVEPL
jgi:hypothetical protein